MRSMPIKHKGHVEFEVGQHAHGWTSGISRCLMDLAPHFIAKYTRLYGILHKSHFDLYTLKLSINFVAHLTFYVPKLKLFLHDEQRP